MFDELRNPTYGDLEDFLEGVEAVRFLSSSSSFSSHNNEIETVSFTTSSNTTFEEFSSILKKLDDSLRCVFEPTPIDPKSAVIVDTFRPANSLWYTTDDNNFLDAVILLRCLLPRTLIHPSPSSKGPADAYHNQEYGPLVKEAPNAPKRDLDNCSSPVPLFSPNKRARMSSTRSEVDYSTSTFSSSGADAAIATCPTAALQGSHTKQWGKRFSELVEYQKEYGHCLMPFNWPPNPSLACWVKRQRYQYRIKNEGKHSSMTPDRLEALQELGFTWDSHSVSWLERWQDLAEFKQVYGHPNVPKNYPENNQLAVWVKCQRRQYKVYEAGKSSNMTPDRIERLNSLGFVFNPRSRKSPSILL
jgi:hypothetical protein